MRSPRYLLITLVLCVFLLFAGCTQSTGSPASANPTGSPAVMTDFTRLAIGLADMPPGFTLDSGAVRNPDDVGSVAKDLGWEGGYSVRYVIPATDKRGPTTITQSIAMYPEKNIPTIIAMSDQQDRSDPDLMYTNIPTPGLGGISRGFFGNASAQILVKPANGNPLATGPGSHEVALVYTREVAEILFAKGTVFEALRMDGPGANMTVLQHIAENAYNKIS